MTSLQFLGATHTVTGSKFVVKVDKFQVMIDCGLFQGLKELRLRNWEPLPVAPHSLDAVILTHAHIDHSGYLPRLVKDGFRGAVYASAGTYDLCRILLPDSAELQEEDARHANQKGFSKHKPALPLYTIKDAKESLKLFDRIRYHDVIKPTKHLSFRLSTSGHILGSTFVEMFITDSHKQETKLVFSGDIGRYDRPILNDPAPVPEADYLLVESTYGDRRHDPQDPQEQIAEIVNETIGRGGTIVIPAFAVGRAQELLYHFIQLEDEGRIPQVPVYIDSPMAIEATTQYISHPEDHDREMKETMAAKLREAKQRITLVRGQTQSQSLARDHKPCVIISSSGMATGGRVLHHLVTRLPHPQNTILFVGYQAAGTRGRLLADGAQEIKIHGQIIPVRAQVRVIHTLSAHADYGEILHWLEGFQRPPRATYVVHGEPSASEALQRHIQEKFGWHVEIPDYAQTVPLGGQGG
jgi:metallo-beta-lactamase family protein